MGVTALHPLVPMRMRSSLLLISLLACLLCQVWSDTNTILLEETVGVGHHPTADMACACCKKFQPSSTSCSWVNCNDGSGKFCWDPNGGGTACTAAQESGTCDVGL